MKQRLAYTKKLEVPDFPTVLNPFLKLCTPRHTMWVIYKTIH